MEWRVKEKALLDEAAKIDYPFYRNEFHKLGLIFNFYGLSKDGSPVRYDLI